jgi:hypothetical protein
VAELEVALPSWQAAVAEDWLGRWAMNLMLVGVTGPPSRQAAMGPGTRRFGRAVRLPEGNVPGEPGSGVSKWPVADLRSPAASRRFVALWPVADLRSPAERLAAWLEQHLSGLDLLAVQKRVPSALARWGPVDGIHLAEDLLLVAAVGIDGEGANRAPIALARWDPCSVRRVCRNVKRWRDASMALRWTAASGAHRARAMGPVMLEAAKGFRRRGHPTKLASWGPPEGEAPVAAASCRALGTPAEA